MNDSPLLQHFLAALAYRTQKALRDAPDGFGDFCVAPGVRTPRQLVRHMTSVLGYLTTQFNGGSYDAEALPTLADEVRRFHDMLEKVHALLDTQSPRDSAITPKRILQGPLADAMTHAGQLAMLRRLYGAPIPPENFMLANVRADNLGPNQPPSTAFGRRDGAWDPRGVEPDK